jgi:hypothetical protein
VVSCIPESGLLPKGNPELLLLAMLLLSVELLKGEAETVFRDDDDDVGMVRYSSREKITKNTARNPVLKQAEFNYYVFKNTIYKNL